MLFSEPALTCHYAQDRHSERSEMELKDLSTEIVTVISIAVRNHYSRRDPSASPQNDTARTGVICALRSKFCVLVR